MLPSFRVQVESLCAGIRERARALMKDHRSRSILPGTPRGIHGMGCQAMTSENCVRRCKWRPSASTR
jgi:hypothetical protein